MTAKGIRIQNRTDGKQIAVGQHTSVFALMEDGTEVDISSAVFSVDATIRMGEPVKANIGVFLTGLETRAVVEQLVTKEVKPRRWSLWRRWREVTSFGSRTGAAEYVK